ncbi:hypothetical protein KAT36_01550 [Candidatus Pacearchaeota archaeon]|nr:hypothetical protein [Candidatus Pacearchaeota archaeon]
MNMKELLGNELKRISLSGSEVSGFRRVANDLIKKLKERGLRAYIGGSLAKGTMVRRLGRQDVDIFVVFDYSEDILGLEKVLKKIDLPGVLKKVHGSRDYFQIVCDGVLLEVIPVVKNKDPELAENVTDVSLSHVKYIGGEVKKNPEIADEIKLAKAFCRANRCYGAESYMHGFSGYSLEILVIYFGGFVKFLKGMTKVGGRKSVVGGRWSVVGGRVKGDEQVVIDPLMYFRNKGEVLRELNSSKLQCPVVLIDPTYKFRNVTAGLGFETFGKFADVAREFLKSSSLEFFKKREIDVEGMKKFAVKNKARFVEINLRTDRQEGDIAGTKMKKLLDFFARELTRKQQKVLMKEFDYLGGQRAKGYLVVEEKLEIEVRGPSVGLGDAIKKFRRAKGDRVFKKKGFWWVRDKSGIVEVFKLVKKVEREMGAGMRIRDF